LAADIPGARQAFLSVLQLDPTHASALQTLVGMHLAAQDTGDAARVLDEFESQADRAVVLSLRVTVAAQMNDQAAACDALKELCAAKFENPGLLKSAVAAIIGRGWRTAALSTLESILRDPISHPQSAAAWAELCMTLRDWKRVRTGLQQLANWPQHWTCVCSVYLTNLNAILMKPKNPRAYARQIRRLLGKNSEQVQADTNLWALAGRAMMIATAYRQTVRLQADWQQRKDLKPWHLIDLAYSLGRLRRHQERNEVCRRAAALQPDQTSSLHQMWLAIDDILDGNCELARRRVHRVSRPSSHPFYQALYGLIRGMVAVDSERRQAGNRLGFWRARKMLRSNLTQSDKRTLREDPVARRLNISCLKKIGRDSKSRFGYVLARLVS
jgi:hypothetical protein